MTIAAILLAIALVLLAIRRPLTTVIICAVTAGVGLALAEKAVSLPIEYAPAVLVGMIAAAISLHVRRRRKEKNNKNDD